MKKVVFFLDTFGLLALAAFLGFLRSRDLITTPDLINILVLGVLAAITAWYAAETSDLARAANRQTEAVQKTAEETTRQAEASQNLMQLAQKQLHQSARPILRVSGELVRGNPIELRLSAKNVGIGPALNVKCWIFLRLSNGGENIMNYTHPNHYYMRQILTSTEGNDSEVSWQREVLGITLDAINTIAFCAIYEDVFGNHFYSESLSTRVDGEVLVGKFSVTEIDGERMATLLRHLRFH